MHLLLIGRNKRLFTPLRTHHLALPSKFNFTFFSPSSSSSSCVASFRLLLLALRLALVLSFALRLLVFLRCFFRLHLLSIDRFSFVFLSLFSFPITVRFPLSRFRIPSGVLRHYFVVSGENKKKCFDNNFHGKDEKMFLRHVLYSEF